MIATDGDSNVCSDSGILLQTTVSVSILVCGLPAADLPLFLGLLIHIPAGTQAQDQTALVTSFVVIAAAA